MTDTVVLERRRGLIYQLILAVVLTILLLMLLLGLAWLQLQVAALMTAQAQRGERLTVVETQLSLLRAEIAELRVRALELDRALARVRGTR